MADHGTHDLQLLFARALIVEDLDEPRQWLAELLPCALPQVKQVDMAANLSEARALMRHFDYGLALVDWGLPDGNSEGLIGELAAARPGAMVIVATIHDDDAHVFPALRAGATGYILKSQPGEVVSAQLQRLGQGEPALSPSIAVRVLRHFQAQMQTLGPAAAVRSAAVPESRRDAPGEPRLEPRQEPRQLTEREIQVLRLIAKGYKSPEVAGLLQISGHTVSTYVRDIYRKLGISSRAEAALEAARRGLVA